MAARRMECISIIKSTKIINPETKYRQAGALLTTQQFRHTTRTIQLSPLREFTSKVPTLAKPQVLWLEADRLVSADLCCTFASFLQGCTVTNCHTSRVFVIKYE